MAGIFPLWQEFESRNAVSEVFYGAQVGLEKDNDLMRELNVNEQLAEGVTWALYCNRLRATLAPNEGPKVIDELINARKLSLYSLYRAERCHLLDGVLRQVLEAEEEVRTVTSVIHKSWQASADTVTILRFHDHLFDLKNLSVWLEQLGEDLSKEDFLQPFRECDYAVDLRHLLEDLAQPRSHENDRYSRSFHKLHKTLEQIPETILESTDLGRMISERFAASPPDISWKTLGETPINQHDIDLKRAATPLAILANVIVALQPWTNYESLQEKWKGEWLVKPAIVNFQAEMKQHAHWMFDILDSEDPEPRNASITSVAASYESMGSLNTVPGEIDRAGILNVHNSPAASVDGSESGERLDDINQTAETTSTNNTNNRTQNVVDLIELAQGLIEFAERGLDLLQDGIFDPPKNPLWDVIRRGRETADSKIFLS